MKIFSKRLCKPKQLSRVYYEISLLKTLDHPNIVKIFEWFEDKERIYLIMELLTGGDLHEKIVQRKKSRWEEEEIASIIQQILYGLNYLH